MTANSYGVNDLGNTYIEVDLSEQHMYYYQNGEDIFESDIVSGNMSYADRQTPAGIFTLYYKKSPDVLRGKQLPNGKYEYEQPVTYWMPFNGGIGFMMLHGSHILAATDILRVVPMAALICRRIKRENFTILFSMVFLSYVSIKK